MKKLNNEEMMMVSGAGSFADKSSGGRVSNDSRGGRGDRSGTGGAPKTCANDIGVGMIKGAITGITRGPGGVMAGAAVGGRIAASQCEKNGNAAGGGGKGSGSGGGNYGAQCNW